MTTGFALMLYENLKVTPFLVLLVPAWLVCGVLTVYYIFINSHSSDSMIGILALIFGFLISVILVAERLLVKHAKISFDKICKGEWLAIVFLSLAYLLAMATG